MSIEQRPSRADRGRGLFIVVLVLGPAAISCSGQGSSGFGYEPPHAKEPPVLGPDVDGPIVIDRTTPASTTGTVPIVEATLALCDTEAGYSVSSLDGSPVLDDFDDGDVHVSENGRVGDWYQYGDDFGTLLTFGESAVDAPGRGGSGYALHVGGVGFTDWGSGAGIGLAYGNDGSCLHDLSAYEGVSFWAKGRVSVTPENDGVERDKSTVRFMLTEADVVPVESGGACDGNSGGCWDSHRVRFAPDECWRLYSFAFSEFEQDGWGKDGGQLDLDQIYNVNFEIGADNDWELWVDDVTFYAESAPQGNVDCSGSTGLGGAGALL